MTRLLSALIHLGAAAFATSAMLLSAAGGHAQAPSSTPSGYYIAVPAAQPTKANLMTRSTPWSLRDGAYVAQRAPERDTILCEMVAKNVGQLASFTVAGKAYEADALAKCNARAK